MPSAEQHQQRADHFLNFLRTIDVDEFCDWYTIVSFYVTVHLVEKLRAGKQEHSRDHPERLFWLSQNHPAIYPSFQELYNLSLVLRYGSSGLPALSAEFVQGHLEQIQMHVQE